MNMVLGLDSIKEASPTLVSLLVLSVATLGIGLERLAQLWRNRKRLATTRQAIGRHVEEDVQAAAAAAALAASDRPHLASHLMAQILGHGRIEPAALRRAQSQIIRQLKRRLWLLATIGSLAPFVGLLGTVLGVMQAFAAMSTAGGGGFEVVSGGISEALVTTAAGLFVGIEAVVLFNFLSTLLSHYTAELAETVEELAEARLRSSAA